MIRKVYCDLITRKLREGGPAWLLKRACQYLLLHASGLLHRPLCGPALGTLMVTYRCNLRCEMCDMPHKAAARHGRGEKEIDTERFKQIIRQFAELGTPGLGFTGGEPLLREDIFELLAETQRLGMIAHLNSNGWHLGDAEADRIVDMGIDSVNISLDGATAATHDRIRGRSGSFARATAAIRRLTDRKQKSGSKVRIKTVAVLSEKNIGEIPQLIALGKELGTECIELIPRQPFASFPGHRPPHDAGMLEAVDGLVEYLLHSGPLDIPLENSPRHLKLFRESFAELPSPVRCHAGYNSLAVDCYGDVFPCVPWINWGKSTGNLGSSSLLETWRSAEYQRERGNMRNCRACYLNCQTELNLLFNL